VPADEVAAAVEAQARRRNERDRLRSEIGRLDGRIEKSGAGDERSAWEREREERRLRLQAVEAEAVPELAYAVAEGGRIGDARIQFKGDPAKPGPSVHRRFLTVLGGQRLPESTAESGRRELADWLFAANNPLTARVFVNRIWQHHFGRGLVPTPNDFGKQGKPPTHPELLDWLAARFIADGWSVKSMHRLILNSRTYRQMTGALDPADPNNERLSRFPRQRLDAESIRDTLLWHGGNLDLTPAGPHPFPPEDDWQFTQHNPFKAVYESRKRSDFLMTQRIQRHSFLGIFDGADPSASTPVRGSSTTPLQALFLLNDPLVHAQARAFAARVRQAAPDDASRIRFAIHGLLARPATEAEIAESLQFLGAARAALRRSGATDAPVEEDAWSALVRSLLQLSEFVYLD